MTVWRYWFVSDRNRTLAPKCQKRSHNTRNETLTCDTHTLTREQKRVKSIMDEEETASELRAREEDQRRKVF